MTCAQRCRLVNTAQLILSGYLGVSEETYSVKRKIG